jgi:hypothetical protein
MSTGHITIRLALAQRHHVTVLLGAVRAEAGTPIAFYRPAGHFAIKVQGGIPQIYQKSR